MNADERPHQADADAAPEAGAVEAAAADASAAVAKAGAHAGVARASWGDTLSRRRIAFILVSIMLGMLLGALDQTVVGTAMPRVIADLNGMQHYAWVTTGYLLASAASMPIWGKLSDAFGRRRFFIIGMALFLVGSALCGQSRSMTELIAFRGIQGLGSGAMMPINQAIIGDIFPPATRAKWSGLMMSVFGFASIVGPIFGGWITDTIGWRWTFYVNLPVGAIGIVLALMALPHHQKMRKHVIDYAGATLIVVAAVTLLLAFSWAGSQYAWSSPQVLGLIAFSVVTWVVFYLWEMRAEEPIINPRLFTNSIFSVSVTTSALQSAAFFGSITFLPLFVQGVMGKTATNSGTILMPMMISHIVVSMGWGWMLSRWGRYKVVSVFGFCVMAVGAFLLSRLTMGSSSGTLVAFMVLFGVGFGFTLGTSTVVVQNQYPTHRLGEVSAALQFFRSLGGTIGLAVMGSLLNARFASTLAASLPAQLKSIATDPATANQVNNPQVLLSHEAVTRLTGLFSKFGDQSQALLAQFTDAVRHSLESAIGEVFFVMMGLLVFAVIVVFFLKEVPLRRSHSEIAGEELR